MPARAGDDEACGGEGLGEYCGCEGVAPGAGEKRELDGLRRGHPMSYQSRTPRMVNCTGRHVLLTYDTRGQIRWFAIKMAAVAGSRPQCQHHSHMWCLLGLKLTHQDVLSDGTLHDHTDTAPSGYLISTRYKYYQHL